MRIVRYAIEGGSRLAIRKGEDLWDLRGIVPDAPDDLGELLKDRPEILEEVQATDLGSPDRRISDVTLLPPVHRPGKIICLGVNYLDHALEADHQKPEHLVIFYRGGSSLVGDGAPIVRPHCSDQLDFEGELALFIGKQARNLTAQNALSVVAGYAVFNDGSIRDFQTRISQWTHGKNFDGTGAVGEFVSADELPEGASGLRLVTRLNGEIMQDANTADLLYDVRETLILLSQTMTLEPGDMIITGTPGGVGLLRTPPVFMKPGDVCEVEIEKIGVVRNAIAQEAELERTVEALAPHT